MIFTFNIDDSEIRFLLSDLERLKTLLSNRNCIKNVSLASYSKLFFLKFPYLTIRDKKGSQKVDYFRQ